MDYLNTVKMLHQSRVDAVVIHKENYRVDIKLCLTSTSYYWEVIQLGWQFLSLAGKAREVRIRSMLKHYYSESSHGEHQFVKKKNSWTMDIIKIQQFTVLPHYYFREHIWARWDHLTHFFQLQLTKLLLKFTQLLRNN